MTATACGVSPSDFISTVFSSNSLCSVLQARERIEDRHVRVIECCYDNFGEAGAPLASTQSRPVSAVSSENKRHECGVRCGRCRGDGLRGCRQQCRAGRARFKLRSRNRAERILKPPRVDRNFSHFVACSSPLWALSPVHAPGPRILGDPTRPPGHTSHFGRV